MIQVPGTAVQVPGLLSVDENQQVRNTSVPGMLKVDRNYIEVLRIDAWYQVYPYLVNIILDSIANRSSTYKVPGRILHFGIRTINPFNSPINELKFSSISSTPS